jgi:hypothetical protein
MANFQPPTSKGSLGGCAASRELPTSNSQFSTPNPIKVEIGSWELEIGSLELNDLDVGRWQLEVDLAAETLPQAIVH